MENVVFHRPSDQSITEAIDAFAKTICKNPVRLVQHYPHPRASHTDCVMNAFAIQSANGGKVCFGWHFILRPTPRGGWYLIATNHAVWLDPRDDHLMDVTPLHPDPLNQPLRDEHSIVFLLDENAFPLSVKGKNDVTAIVTRPLKFHPVTQDAETLDYVARRNAEELERYNREFGTVIVPESDIIDAQGLDQ